MIVVTSFIAILSTLMLIACVISVRKTKLSDKDHDILSKWAVEEGFVHKDHVKDPSHYDEQGRYLWWGM